MKTYLDSLVLFLFLLFDRILVFMWTLVMLLTIKNYSSIIYNVMPGTTLMKYMYISHYSCGDKILKYKVEGRNIKFPNSHIFPQLCFVELEKGSLDPLIYTPSTSPVL